MMHLNRPITVVVLISMTCSSCSPGGQGSGGRQASAQGTPAAPAQPGSDRTPPQQASPQAPQAAASIDDVVARAKQITDAIPRARYDLAAASDALGPGVEPAFQFVRDRIGVESYSGVLRGAAGTLASRAGNALDRSLLLADILTRKGIRTRFVVGRLDASHADRLITRLFDAGGSAGGNSAFAPSPVPFAFDPFLTRVYTRAARDYTAIRATLGDSMPKRGSVSREELVRELSQHAWVQAEKEGRWIDLDSAFPDAEMEKTFGAADRTFDVLPPELRQQVTIRVVAETLTGRSVAPHTSLEVRLPADELIDRQIFLFHVPGGGKSGLAGAIGGAVLGPDAWAPVLSIDGALYDGDPIVMTGQTAEPERAKPPTGGLGSLFGERGALASRAATFLGEWLEFEMLLPSGRRETIRRPLVDRAGEAWRQSATFDAEILRSLPRDQEGLLAPRQIHNIWYSAGRHDLADYADASGDLARWAKAIGDSPPPADLPFGRAVWPFALHNFAFFLLSDHAVVPSLNDSGSRRFYADSPRILIASAGPAVTNNTPSFQIEYDLRRDAIRGVARDASGEAGVVERKIWFGALEGALEHELGERYTAAGHLKSAGLVSTSALLTAEGAVMLRPEDAGRTRQLIADPETAALAERDLKTGAILVTPRGVLQGGPSGWWTVDGARADTRAVLENGAGGFKGNYPRVEWKAGRVVGEGRWDATTGHRTGGQYSSKETKKSKAPHEYLMVIAFITVGVIVTGFLLVQFYRQVIVPAMATQTQEAVQTGITADGQR